MVRSLSGDDRLSAEADCIADGRLDERRAAGRDRDVVVLGRDVVDLVLDVDGFAAALADVRDVDADRAEVVRGLVVVLARDVVLLDRVADVLPLLLAAAAGFAADMVLAAAVSALAAFVMALVAVFIARMADDIVFAEAVALVAAAVILVAAEVTLVAADDTVLAAAAGVAEFRLAVLLRAVVARPVVERDVVERDVVERGAVERDVVERDAVLRVDLAAVPLLVVLAPVLRDDAAVLRAVRGLALDVLELDGRLAVPLDALRLAVLPAVLAELRRVAARVVD